MSVGEMYCSVCKVPFEKVTAMLVERRMLLAAKMGWALHDFWCQVAITVAVYGVVAIVRYAVTVVMVCAATSARPGPRRRRCARASGSRTCRLE